MKSFSELTSASQVNNGDLLAISQTSGSGYASKKTTVKDITDKSNLNLAEEYDSTSTYAVDDYVIYESVLYKCIASTTGTFDSTKWTSVVVTDEMGSGGGGGTGGHTIIDENGNSMSARAGLQFVGGANVSDDSTNNKTIVDLASAGGIDGVFIDTGNVIKSATNFTGSLSYTATEDCAFCLYLVTQANVSAQVKIDGVTIIDYWKSSMDTPSFPPIFLKKGQILSVLNANASYDSTYRIYGIQTGTTHSKFQPVIYSTEERVIGVWKDGRPLYEKTVDFGALPNNTTKTVSYNISDLDYFVKIQCVAHNQNGSRNIPFVDDASKTGDVLLDTIKSSGVIRIIAHTDLSSLTGDVTLQYVKSSDVAGSGSWTPQGVPTHHYSMDEHIVGTWMGETLWEKTLVFDNPTKVSYSTFYQYECNYDSGNIDFAKMVNINVYDSTDDRWYEIPYERLSTEEDIKAMERVASHNYICLVFFKNNQAYNLTKIVYTIQYTKSS